MITDQYPNRRSVRLYGYDYSQDGLYFVTLCVQDRACLFGRVEDGILKLNKLGKIAEQCWMDIPNHYPHIKLHEYVIMPNHIHGILEIDEYIPVGAKNLSPENDIEFRSPSKTIGSVIRGFKIGVTKWYKQNYLRANNYSPLPIGKSIWQRNYYEHIIRDERGHFDITEYIENNHFNWKTDNYYTDQHI